MLRLAASESLRSLNHLGPTYMFDSTEVIDEYNLLNTFLNRNLLENESSRRSAQKPLDVDSKSIQSTESQSTPKMKSCVDDYREADSGNAMLPRSGLRFKAPTKFVLDEAQEKYYFTAADPAENGFPEERINRLLKAKYDAGMLKPFNYVKGYARLNRYMEHNLQEQSRQRILRQLNGFRPNFRKQMHKLTDIELVMVEMWFERMLMEYERIFASMAVPACCWRRTGEVFRGNREMAELINVNIDELRDVC